MKTHGFYWYVRCVAQPSGILAAGMTITRGAIPNCVTGSQQQPPGSGAPRRITEGTLCTPDNAQRQLHERALQTAPLLHGVTNPPGWKGWRRGLSRERGAPGKVQLKRGQGHRALGKFHCKTLTPLQCMYWKQDFSKDSYLTKLMGFVCVFVEWEQHKTHL